MTFEPGIITRIITVTPIVCLVSTIAIANFELLRKLPHFRRLLRRFIAKSGRGRKKLRAVRAHQLNINLIHTELPHFANPSYGPDFLSCSESYLGGHFFTCQKYFASAIFAQGTPPLYGACSFNYKDYIIYRHFHLDWSVIVFMPMACRKCPFDSGFVNRSATITFVGQ